MAQIRIIDIKHFRSIKSLVWSPQAGINCLIGNGDGGKSTILDAIDLCLGARRTIQFTDSDFFELDISEPITLTLTIGDLPDNLKALDAYGLFLRGFDAASNQVEDEPRAGLETVICLQLIVGADLEPVWGLVSDRAVAMGQERGLSWSDRLVLAPTRIGAVTDTNLSWRRGSVLNRISEEKADASMILLSAARSAREDFAKIAKAQLSDALTKVKTIADSLGIGSGGDLRAELDAHSVTTGGGTISLHDDRGIPLRSMGIGSTRLLIAGLQKEAAEGTSIVLVDEVEHGLEPHRIIRLIDALGAKDTSPTLQVFMTSHSPIVVRELKVSQLTIVRRSGPDHTLSWLGDHSDLQGVVRTYPEALLAPNVLICEGASEVGFTRGIDQWCVDAGKKSFHASGTCLVDAKGVTNIIRTALAFLNLGYRTAILRDDDEQPDPVAEQTFAVQGGTVFKCRPGMKIEAELFDSLPVAAVGDLLDLALESEEEQRIDDQLKSASNNIVTLPIVRAEIVKGSLSSEVRAALGSASGKKKTGWFKNVSTMEYIARHVVAPRAKEVDVGFSQLFVRVRNWCIGA